MLLHDGYYWMIHPNHAPKEIVHVREQQYYDGQNWINLPNPEFGIQFHGPVIYREEDYVTVCV